MAEVIGLVAFITQVIGVTTKTIQYLSDVKDAPKERAKLAREASSLVALLTDLRYKAEDVKSIDPWFASVRSLGADMGPLQQFRDAMEELGRKLKPQTGVAKFGKALLWTIDKNDIKDILAKIERLKTTVGLALQIDHL